MNDPFTWGFTGRKGTSECGGTFQRVPFSTSITESCFDTSPPAPKTPVRPQHEVLADGFRSLLAGLSTSPITTQCNRIEPGATSATCTATTEGHPPVEVVFAKKGDDWTMDRPSRILSRNGLGDSISNELREKRKKPSAVVGCGTLQRRRHAHVHRFASRPEEARERRRHVWRQRRVHVEGHRDLRPSTVISVGDHGALREVAESPGSGTG